MQKIKKFLEFNGKTILFISVNGIIYIAVRPICEALEVNYNRQFQNLKEDPILKDEFAIQQILAPDNRLRNFVCLPEQFIYGWIFSMKSSSAELLRYKKKCYQVLFEYFHGTITRRKEVLEQVVKDSTEAETLRGRLNENEDFKRLNELDASIMRAGKTLKQLDGDMITDIQLSLFQS
jgi:hypothetical protein